MYSTQAPVILDIKAKVADMIEPNIATSIRVFTEIKHAVNMSNGE